MAEYENNEMEVNEMESETSSVASSKGGEYDNEINEFDSDIEGGAIDDEIDEEEEQDEEEEEDESNVNKQIEDEYNETESSSSESDEEDDDDDYLQKLDESVRKRVVEDHHPELKTLNYEEVEALATITRDKDNNIIDPLHKTLPILTRYEKARILGERARQINGGARPFIDVDASMIDGYLIALKELEQKRIPFIIQRPMPNGGSEYWRVSDLE
jgi:DNA-directed RNA polymerase I, II, and III subunit RPABC2